MTSLNVNVNRVARGITLRITGQREFAVRTWIAIRVFELGAWILGVRVEIELQNKTDAC